MADDPKSGPLGVLFSVVAWILVLLVPLMGTWLASSLAAYGHQNRIGSVVIGLALFPTAPLVWELASTLRSGKKRWLRRRDRLVLRTLVTSLVFLIALLVLFPKTAFTALSTRGDFLFDGHEGAFADHGRSLAHDSAKGLEWLYLATRETPFDSSDVAPAATEIAARPPVPAPKAAPSTSATVKADGNAPAIAILPPSSVQTAPFSWPSSDTKLSPVVTTMPPEAEASPASIGGYIAQHEPSQAGRARAVHDWVADRIAYDGPSYRAGLYPPQDADTVLKKRVGVCAGYARLFSAIAKAAGLEARYVVGTVRGSDMRPDGESHAWNAVKIDGAWTLVDTTWDAGYLEGATFVKRYKMVYFGTPFEVFRVDHFPDEKEWQLGPPIDRGEFFRRPMMSAEFFADGFGLVRPERSQVTSLGPFSVELSNPKKLFVLVQDQKKNCKVTREGEKISATCPVAEAGSHRIELYSSNVEFGSYHYVGHVEVNRL
jgi:hypothetical protein